MGKSQYNGYHVAGALVFGLGAGACLGMFLGRLLHRRTFEAELVRAMEAEHRHRESRPSAASDGGDTMERSVCAVANTAGSDSVLDDESDLPAAATSREGVAEAGESEEGSSDYDPGPVAPDGMDWPPVDRDRSKPYIISAEEFAESEYFTCSWNWMQGDKIPVMVDEKNEHVQHYAQLVGPIGYRIFGGVSGDENIVYIRNEKRETDFEIVRRYGSYAEEILNYGNPGP